MITIKINYKNDTIDHILIKGHANYDVSGKDIVCASVSSIVITTVNALLKFDEKSISYSQNDDLEVCVLKHTKGIDLLMNNMISLLEELTNQYNKYIKIVKENWYEINDIKYSVICT